MVYIVNEEGTSYYKIGFTDDIDARLKSLQTANAHNLKFVYGIETDDPRKLEKTLHSHFARDKMYGEWFEIEDFQTEIWIVEKKLLNPTYNDWAGQVCHHCGILFNEETWSDAHSLHREGCVNEEIMQGICECDIMVHAECCQICNKEK